jgi:hypothetical protein
MREREREIEVGREGMGKRGSERNRHGRESDMGR